MYGPMQPMSDMRRDECRLIEPPATHPLRMERYGNQCFGRFVAIQRAREHPPEKTRSPPVTTVFKCFQGVGDRITINECGKRGTLGVGARTPRQARQTVGTEIDGAEIALSLTKVTTRR